MNGNDYVEETNYSAIISEIFFFKKFKKQWFVMDYKFCM